MNNWDHKNIYINNIRLWKNNPRFERKADIKINNIGKENFNIDDDILLEDYYKDRDFLDICWKFINNIEKAASMLDLISSISDGYNYNIDDILVVKPEWIFNMAIGKWDYINDIYYVIEGNRRLFAIKLLIDEDNILNLFKKKIEEEENKKNFRENKSYKSWRKIIESIFNEINKFEKKNYKFERIYCKVLNYTYFSNLYGERELNATLNCKHFGIRKGKLNWPRLIMLGKIYNMVKKYVFNNFYDSSLESTKKIEIDKKMCRYIESNLGKKISVADIKNSIFVYEIVKIWISRDNNEKRTFSIFENSESGDISESRNFIFDDDIYKEGNDDSKNLDFLLTFSASSLELSKSVIKLLNSKYKKVKLSEVIEYQDNINLKNEYWLKVKNLETNEYFENNYENDSNVFGQIVEIIISGIFNKKITTRFSDEEIGENIHKILYKVVDLDFDKLMNLNIKDVKNLNNLNNKDNKILKIIKLISDIDESSKEWIKNNDDLVHNKSTKHFFHVLKYIWYIEYKSVFFNENNFPLIELPILSISALIRTTIDFIGNFLYSALIIFYIDNYPNLKQRFEDKVEYCNYLEEIVKNSFSNNVLFSFFLKDQNLKKFLQNWESYLKENNHFKNDIKTILDFIIYPYDYLIDDRFESKEVFLMEDKENEKNKIFDFNDSFLSKIKDTKFNGIHILKKHILEIKEEKKIKSLKKEDILSFLNWFLSEHFQNEQIAENIKSLIELFFLKKISEDFQQKDFCTLEYINFLLHKPSFITKIFKDSSLFLTFLENLKEIQKLIFKILE